MVFFFFSNEHTCTGSNLFIPLLVQGWNSLQKQAAAQREPRLWFRGEMEPLPRDCPGSRPKGHSFTDSPWHHWWESVQLPPVQRAFIWIFNFFFRKLFLYHSWSLFVRMEIILTHLRLFSPCSLFLLQSDETSLVSFPFGNRQIHFLIFSHAKHSKKTAHGGDQNTSLKPFLLILCFVIILFLFFLQHHGNIESKLGCQQHLKRDKQSLVSVRIHRQSYQKRGKHLSSESA